MDGRAVFRFQQGRNSGQMAHVDEKRMVDFVPELSQPSGNKCAEVFDSGVQAFIEI